MADNKVLPFTGTGDANATFATDEIAGVNWQRIKLTLGADGVNDGDIASGNPMPVEVVATQTPIPVGNYAIASTASFTRPNDATAYTAGDVVCNSTSAPTILTFADASRASGGSGTIIGASMVLGTNPATKPIYELWLFNTSVTIDNDNAGFTPTDTEMQSCVAVIPLAAPVIGDVSSTATSLYYAWDGAKAFVTSGGTSLYGVLVAKSGVTPTAVDTYYLRLIIARD